MDIFFPWQCRLFTRGSEKPPALWQAATQTINNSTSRGIPHKNKSFTYKTFALSGLLIMMRKRFVSQLLFGRWHRISSARWAKEHDCLLLNWAPAETQRAQARCWTESFITFLSIGCVPAFLPHLMGSKGKLSPFVLHFHNYCLWAAPAAQNSNFLCQILLQRLTLCSHL